MVNACAPPWKCNPKGCQSRLKEGLRTRAAPENASKKGVGARNLLRCKRLGGFFHSSDALTSLDFTHLSAALRSHWVDLGWTWRGCTSSRFRVHPPSPRLRGRNLAPAPDPLSSTKWRRGPGRGCDLQIERCQSAQKPLSPTLSPRFAAGRGSRTWCGCQVAPR